jgi:UTP--glucose-1-phosphate uridylyltransferase
MMHDLERVRKAVFPAAGLGTRFLPATKAMPKEMLPLVDKPLIQYAVEEVVQSGINDICIVTGRGKAAIEDHFDVSFELECLLESRKQYDLLRSVRAISERIDISYVRQREALGLGHAVLRARSQIGNEPFVVVLADDVIDAAVPCTKQLLEIFEQFHGPVIALMEVPTESVSSYGIVTAHPVGGSGPEGLYRITDLIEKPSTDQAPSNLAVIGRYVLTPDVFELLAQASPGHGAEIQLTDALRIMAKRRDLFGLRFTGQRYDAGDKLGFLIANIELGLRRDGFGERLLEYLERRFSQAATLNQGQKSVR